jgi:hypothetical protein
LRIPKQARITSLSTAIADRARTVCKLKPYEVRLHIFPGKLLLDLFQLDPEDQTMKGGGTLFG